jgi:CubicO group peptidase (beta-lactamase class C family)
VTAAHAVAGTVAPGFEGVRDAFERNLTEHGETGGAFAAVADGALVADLWGGVADPATGRPWSERTCAVIFSGTKGVVATALLVLVDRGRLDLGARVGDVWPEFAAAGKAEITIAQLCSHCGGLPGLSVPFDIREPRAMARALAAQAPIVPVGSPSYHAITFGWLADELVRRVDGRGVGTFVREELALPLGDLDIRIGLDPGDELASERAQLRVGAIFQLGAFGVAEPDPRLELVYGASRAAPEFWNDPAVLVIGVPAAGGVANASALATLYGRLVAPGGPVALDALERCLQPAGTGDDPLTGRPLRFGPTGYELAGTPSALGPAADAFGHTGAGGSSHGGWPSLRTGFSYVTAELRSEDDDQRARTLLAALHEALTAE